jgi:hypothetical protein
MPVLTKGEAEMVGSWSQADLGKRESQSKKLKQKRLAEQLRSKCPEFNPIPPKIKENPKHCRCSPWWSACLEYPRSIPTTRERERERERRGQ